MYSYLRSQGFTRFHHPVEIGETVLKIANKYPHTSIEAIILANHLVVPIYPGQVLSVGHFKPPHKVIQGESVYKIAIDNGTTMEQIILDNNLVVPIYPGQMLLIP